MPGMVETYLCLFFRILRACSSTKVCKNFAFCAKRTAKIGNEACLANWGFKIFHISHAQPYAQALGIGHQALGNAEQMLSA
jgi:hypothetical protein